MVGSLAHQSIVGFDSLSTDYTLNITPTDGKYATEAKRTSKMSTTDYCTTSDVWGVTTKESTKEHWDAFWRSREGGVSIKVKQKNPDKPLDPYQKTLEAIRTGKMAAPAKSTRSESTSGKGVNSTKYQIWPKDVFGNKVDISSEVAHLLPAGKTAHAEWCGVAAAVLGLPKSSSVEEQLMATRGVKKEEVEEKEEDSTMPVATRTRSGNRGAVSQNGKKNAAQDSSDTANARSPPPRKKGMKRKRSKISFAEDATPDKSQDTARSSVARKQLMDHTGVVHFVSNKIRLQQQGYLLDGDAPTLLIVPCMTVERANIWKGEKYKAVVLAGLPCYSNVPEAYDDAYAGLSHGEIAAGVAEKGRLDGHLAKQCFKKLGLNKNEQEDLLTKARQGLEGAVLGLTEFVKGASGNNQMPEELSKRFTDVLKGGVLTPKRLATSRGKPVRVVEFGDLQDRDVHPAPDPLLLLAKAATVWGKMVGVTLLAGGKPEEDEEDSDSLDEVAEEDFLERFRSSSSEIPKVISVVTPGLPSRIGY